MANRSYLYAIGAPPRTPGGNPRAIGLHEWNYDVPLTHLLLASADPMTSQSAIYGVNEQLAIVGDYNRGLQKLEAFLETLNEPTIE